MLLPTSAPPSSPLPWITPATRKPLLQLRQRNSMRRGGGEIDRQLQHSLITNHVGLLDLFQPRRRCFKHAARVDGG